jgi:protoporphyrinogen oxidase
MVKDFKNKVFIGLEYFCTENDEFWSLSNEQLKAYAEAELIKLGIIEKGKIEDYHVEKVKKAYPAYFDTYDKIGIVIKYLNTVDNLFCIGRNGQHRYNNMDHSMVTAFRAVDCILEKADKNAIWNVNTDQEYHEEKNNG